MKKRQIRYDSIPVPDSIRAFLEFREDGEAKERSAEAARRRMIERQTKRR